MVPTKLGKYKESQKTIRLFILTLNRCKHLKIISSSFTKYRAIAFKVTKSEWMSFFLLLLWENQSIGIGFFYLSQFFGKQPIRIQHFLQVNSLSFFKNLNYYLKKVYQKTVKFPRVSSQEKWKKSNWFSIS